MPSERPQAFGLDASREYPNREYIPRSRPALYLPPEPKRYPHYVRAAIWAIALGLCGSLFWVAARAIVAILNGAS